MKELDRVTLCIVDTKFYGQAINSLKKSLDQIKPAKTIFFTDISVKIDFECEIIKILPINSKKEYSQFIFKELYKYIDTDFVLVSQHDGWVLGGEQWNDEFYNYDYIGASWLYETGRNVGNGGFSLRSKRLQTVLGEDDFFDVVHPEDQSIGIIYRNYLEQRYDIKFPSEELADTFSYELKTPACKTFGFHGKFHKPFQETIMITRKGAAGDVIALEPLLHYYYLKGYRVVLNTSPNFFNYFLNHYFKIHHPRELDGRLKVKEINLDLAYEVFPKQLHLKSYFDMCGISDYELRNPILCLNFDAKEKPNKLFKKYCVIHVDERPQNGRNIIGVNWFEIVIHLESLGYTVLQIGVGKHADIGAIQMSTPSEQFLQWVVCGADLFLGIDSAPAHVAVAMKTPAIVFFGSVNPDYIYPDASVVEIIQYENICPLPKCWHEQIGESSNECIVDESKPPCIKFTNKQVLEAIKKITNGQNKSI